jgi:hypothetical protein
MSGRKRPHVEREVVDYLYEEFRIDSMKEQIASMKKENKAQNKVIAEYQNRLHKTEENARRNQDKISQIDNEIKKINKREENKKFAAQAYLRFMKEQQAVLNDLEYHRFYSDDYKKLELQVTAAETNIQEENYEAAIAILQSESNDITVNSKKIEDRYLRGKELEYEIEVAFELLSKKMQDKYLEREFDTIDDDKVIESIDVTYWAEKEWKNTEEIFQELKRDFANINKLNIEELTKYRETIDKCVNEYNISFKKAEESFLNYIIIQGKQEAAANELKNLGFQIVDNIYENDDERSNNILLMENERGEKILVNFWDQDGNIECEANFNDLNPLTHNERFHGILKAIGSNKYDEVKGYEGKPAEKEIFDLSRYRERDANR